MITENTKSRLNGLRVILMDNHLKSQEKLAGQLGKLGCRVKIVHSYTDVHAALVRGFLSNEPFKVLLVNLSRAFPDEKEFLHSFQTDEMASYTRIIPMMSAAHHKKAGAFSSDGSSSIIFKPVRRSDLAKVLASTTDPSRKDQDRSKVGRKLNTEEPHKGKQLKILLVEDDELNLKMSSIIFTHLGHNIDVAVGGEDAIKLLERDLFDLVFIDIQMPGMNGLEASTRIRGLSNKNKDIPIIAMTGHEAEKYAQLCRDAGMNDYLSKPFAISRISQILNKYISGDYKYPGTPFSAQATAISKADEPIFDPSVGMAVFHQDKCQFGKFLKLFIVGFPDRMKKLISSAKIKDWKLLEIEAHNLKGISANLGANKISIIASQLESNSKQGFETSVQAGLKELESAITEFEFMIHEMVV